MKKTTFFCVIAAALLLGTGFLGCSSIPPAELIPADNTTATVYFIMANPGVTVTLTGIQMGTQFSLWDGDTYLSNIKGNTYIKLNFRAGTHYFMSTSHNTLSIWDIVRADLEAGESYYLSVVTLPGPSGANVRFNYIDPRDPLLPGYLNDCTETAPFGSTTKDYTDEAGRKLASALRNPQNINRIPPR